MLIRKPVFYMAEGDGGAGAGEGGAGDGGASGGGGAGSDAGTGDQGKPAEGKTFTEADVERIIQGRLSKYADYDDVKQQLTELQQANQSESEKALNSAKEEGRKEARLEAGEAVALEVFNGAAGRRNPEYDTAPALELLSLRKFVKDDGTVDRDGITQAVERLVPEKAQTPGTPKPDSSQGSKGEDRKTTTADVFAEWADDNFQTL